MNSAADLFKKAPSMRELTERLEKLEEKKLAVTDLPLAALQRRLESTWRPEFSTLFDAGIIDNKTGKKIRVYGPFEAATGAVGGGSTTDVTVTHNLDIANATDRCYLIGAPIQAGHHFRWGALSRNQNDVVIRARNASGGTESFVLGFFLVVLDD